MVNRFALMLGLVALAACATHPYAPQPPEIQLPSYCVGRLFPCKLFCTWKTVYVLDITDLVHPGTFIWKTKDEVCNP